MVRSKAQPPVRQRARQPSSSSTAPPPSPLPALRGAALTPADEPGEGPVVVREALPLAEPPRHRLRPQKPIAVELGHAAPKVRQAEEGLQDPELPRRDLGVPRPRHPEHRPPKPTFEREGGAPVYEHGGKEEVRHEHVVVVVVCVALLGTCQSTQCASRMRHVLTW